MSDCDTSFDAFRAVVEDFSDSGKRKPFRGNAARTCRI